MIDDHAARAARKADQPVQWMSHRDALYYQEQREARLRASGTTYNQRPTFGSAMNVSEQKYKHLALEQCHEDRTQQPKPLLLPINSLYTPLPPVAQRDAFKPSSSDQSYKLLPTLRPPIGRRGAAPLRKRQRQKGRPA